MKEVSGYFDKVWPTQEGFKANCPMCGNNDRTFNWNTDKGVGCCWHASCSWYQGNGGVTEGRLVAYFKGTGFEYRIPDRIEVAENAELKLPDSFKTIRDIQPKSLRLSLYAYLSYRGIDRKMVNRAKLGYCKAGARWGYIIIPVFDNGEVVYWQARRFKEREPKFYNPKSSNKGDVLYCVSKFKRPKLGIIVESALNALTLEMARRKGVVVWALLCKSLSDTQLERILYAERSLERVVVALDNGAERDAALIADRLSQPNKVKKVSIAYFNSEKDINDLGQDKAWKRIESAIDYDPRRKMEFLQRKAS